MHTKIGHVVDVVYSVERRICMIRKELQKFKRKFTCCHSLLVELCHRDVIHALQFFPFGLRQQKMSDPIQQRHSGDVEKKIICCG